MVLTSDTPQEQAHLSLWTLPAGASPTARMGHNIVGLTWGSSTTYYHLLATTDGKARFEVANPAWMDGFLNNPNMMYETKRITPTQYANAMTVVTGLFATYNKGNIRYDMIKNNCATTAGAILSGAGYVPTHPAAFLPEVLHEDFASKW